MSHSVPVATALHLRGCRPEPLGSYLQAIGVLRLVGAQADPSAAGWWEGDTFRLASTLDREALVAFFVDHYQPTPLVAPWNKGSGFKEEKNPKAVASLDVIESSTDERLAPYRQAVAVARGIYDESQAAGWPKADVIEACRGRFPDEAVDWIDAAVVLAGDEPSYPPMLGTGGNDGRFDFTIAFMSRLAEVLCLSSRRGAPTRAMSQAWLDAALFADADVALVAEAVGQFDPGGAGGVNSSPHGPADSLVNPWSWTLLIEGALVFASASARRLSAGARGRAAVPFTVEASPVGYPSAAGAESSRGEVWAPLWRRPATAAELAQLVGEGRSDWRRHVAASGLDMARAAASLGVDRGITCFVRHALVERNGLATVAVPAGRVSVVSRPEVPVVGQLDPWLGRIRGRREKPAAIESALHRVDGLLFDLAARGGNERVVEVLGAVADLEAAVGRSPRFRDDARVGPVQRLAAMDWFPHLDDGSHEFRLAASLASMSDPDRPAGIDDGREVRAATTLRSLLRPVVRQGLRWSWSPAPASVGGFGLRPIHQVLAAAHARRAVELSACGNGGEASGPVGRPTAFASFVSAPVGAIARFVAAELDDERLRRLLGALLLLDWSSRPDVSGWYRVEGAHDPDPVVPAWWLLAPFFAARRKKADGEPPLLPEASWPAQLAAGQTPDVLHAALRRLRIAHMRPLLTDASVETLSVPPGPGGDRLAAALLCPVGPGPGSHLLCRVVRCNKQGELITQEDQL